MLDVPTFNSSNLILEDARCGHARDCWLTSFFFYTHTLCIDGFVMSAPEETSPYNSDS